MTNSNQTIILPNLNDPENTVIKSEITGTEFKPPVKARIANILENFDRIQALPEPEPARDYDDPEVTWQLLQHSKPELAVADLLATVWPSGNNPKYPCEQLWSGLKLKFVIRHDATTTRLQLTLNDRNYRIGETRIHDIEYEYESSVIKTVDKITEQLDRKSVV